ncbi:uncharacterized protein [Primulina huaijiensis]|uniref:uncharacterized protein n=1 Tax=Primulina huaijiensis TaxID=1492673 RepID=UPI003CC6EF60
MAPATANMPGSSSLSGHSAIEDPMSPYFLHHVDKSGLMLVSEALTGENYISWSRVMKIALSVKKQLGFIDRSIAKPSDNELILLKFRKRSQPVLSSLNQQQKYGKISKNVFNKAMGQEFFNCDVSWSQILLLDPFLPINLVFSLIVQEERQRATGSQYAGNNSVGSMTFTVKGEQQQRPINNRGRTPSLRERPFRTKCNIHGRTVDTCYKIHGYPPGYKLKGNFPSKYSPAESLTKRMIGKGRKVEGLYVLENLTEAQVVAVNQVSVDT